MKLKGSVSSAVRAKEGHSQVRVQISGFGEVIFSGPKNQLDAMFGILDDEEVTIDVSWPSEAA